MKNNECHSVSPRARLNMLFEQYRMVRDDASRDALRIAAYEAYSLDYLLRKFFSWPTTWVEEIGIKLNKKIDDAIDDPSVIEASFSGYVCWWLRSIMDSVKSKRSWEVESLPSAPDGDDMISDDDAYLSDTTTGINETRDSDRRTAATNVEAKERRSFGRMLWAEAWNTPGQRGTILRYYMMGLLMREQGTNKEEFKYKGIAHKLGLNPNTVASEIRRAKLSLRESFLEHAQAWGIVD